jgi:hypothetical protein
MAINAASAVTSGIVGGTSLEGMVLPPQKISPEQGNRIIGEIAYSPEIHVMTKMSGISKIQSIKEDAFIDHIRRFVF